MRKGKCKGLSLEFHEVYLLVSLGYILTGNYLCLIVFTSLILVHEFGHFLMARLFGVKVLKIIIYPFGGWTKLDMFVNFSIARELLIAMAGVIMQFLFYLFLCFLGNMHIIRSDVISLVSFYNSQMIFFNLLPIYPLDGGKIIYLLINYFVPFCISNLIIVISFLLMIFLIIFLNIYSFNYSNIMIYFLLIYYLFQFYRKRKYLLERFLLERYLYSFDFFRFKIIKNYRYMYKDRGHFFKKDGGLLYEKDILLELFE